MTCGRELVTLLVYVTLCLRRGGIYDFKNIFLKNKIKITQLKN